MLAESLKGIISQKLISSKDGKQVPAVEVIVVTPPVSHLIRDHKTFKLPSIVETSRNLGMQTLEDSLLDLLENGIIDEKVARIAATDYAQFDEMLMKRRGQIWQ